MIELELVKDISEYKVPFIFNFTLRETLCGGGGLLAAVVSFNIIKHFTDSGIRIIIPLCFVAIGFLFGWVKRYGLPFEKYLLSQIFTTILPPKVRKYKTCNAYEVLYNQLEKEEQAAAKAEQQNAKQKPPGKKKNTKKGDKDA